ncbi:MAG: phosphoribosyltransferase family protein [Patescibacteria group bacterium]|jgi:orotate phosphoribosyltransferase
MSENKRVLNAVAKMKISVGPFRQSTTGAIVPFFNDSRCLYSHPEVMEIIAEELGKIINKYNRKKRVDLIVGIPMAGIPIALATSLKTRIPFAYLNKKRKPTLRKKWVEGDYQKNSVGVLVDDVIGLGSTVLKAIQDCAKDGIRVKHVVVINDSWHARNQNFKKRLQKMGITFDNLYNRHEWLDYVRKAKKLPVEAITVQKAYLADPTGWHKDKKSWRMFLAWKKSLKKDEL